MLLRRIARPLLAAPFVYDGIQAALHPAEHVDTAREASMLVTRTVGTPSLSDRQLGLLVRAHGAATAVAGLLLALGRTPRTAALALAALTAPLAVAHQPFTSKGAERNERTAAFVKDLGKVGAAVIAGIDLEGRPGVTYRVQQARDHAADLAEAKAKTIKATTKAEAAAVRAKVAKIV
ncbi:DoxX family membrane protein [Isoptericola sp. NEAU-Y5]|uniref:DoxX family membrane protein n=1 Tax=Isoptericola luteus TaxID=2879484 RepID=A0ABS7ZJT5_9MICO|nr:DoxX family membrane protein [Isoptericola sp. NEAU-Y5]MCA5894621.1 DoxX family membrane protein [Isoptericola sp. NEAU-Y5]